VVTPFNALAGDARSLQGLRSVAAGDPKAAAQEAAKQFEALFMQELMKSMRAAQVGTSLFDNDASRMGTEMLDAQMATSSAGRPGGLSQLIAKQLERQMGLNPGPIPKPEIKPLVPPTTTDSDRAARVPRIPERTAAAFLQRHEQAAQAAERASGIPATFMLAQAGHESGWGQRELRHADGTPTHNLFGIKAGTGWKGAVAEVTTTEYADGQPRRVVQRFRAYASPAESFADYAALMKSQRYQAVRAAGADAQAFASGLQRAGYASDPRYADKLSGAIATAQRLRGGTA